MREHFVWQYSLIFGLIRLFGSLWIGAVERNTQQSHTAALLFTFHGHKPEQLHLSICCSKDIHKTLNRNKVCMLDLHDNIWEEDERMYNLYSVSDGLQILAAMDTDAHRVSAHHWLQHRTKDRKVDKNSQTNLRTVSVEPSQSDPGLTDARRFVKTDVRHLNVTAAAATRPDTGAPATGTFTVKV